MNENEKKNWQNQQRPATILSDLEHRKLPGTGKKAIRTDLFTNNNYRQPTGEPILVGAR